MGPYAAPLRLYNLATKLWPIILIVSKSENTCMCHLFFQYFKGHFNKELNTVRLQTHILLQRFDIKAHVLYISRDIHFFSAMEAGHQNTPFISSLPRPRTAPSSTDNSSGIQRRRSRTAGAGDHRQGCREEISERTWLGVLSPTRHEVPAPFCHTAIGSICISGRWSEWFEERNTQRG